MKNITNRKEKDKIKNSKSCKATAINKKPSFSDSDFIESPQKNNLILNSKEFSTNVSFTENIFNDLNDNGNFNLLLFFLKKKFLGSFLYFLN